MASICGFISISITVVYNKLQAENVGIARFLKYLKHKVYTPRPIIQLFTAVKHGNFQMKMYDIVVFLFLLFFFCFNIDREFTYLNSLVCVGPGRSPEESFFLL